MAVDLEQSQAWCHEQMRVAARNFYYGMRLLVPPKRHAMHALYAWMRWIDDLADGPDDQRDQDRDLPAVRRSLENWRRLTHEALVGRTETHPMFPALAEAVGAFGIPHRLLDEAIDGQLQDLEQSRYHSFDELYAYCYRVASTVGIAAVYVWRFSTPEAIRLAEYRGIAFQLTNILRDLREDAGRGRIYLPQEDLARFGVSDLQTASPNLAELIAFQARRAMEYYRQSARLESMVEPDSRPTLRVMTAIYGGLLEQIAADPLAVLRERVSLSGARKLGEVVRQLYLDQKTAIDGAYES